MATEIKITALGFERPLLDELAARLMAHAETRAGFADLSFVTIAAPTAEAGRLLREKLADAAAPIGGILPPQVMLPARLTSTETATDAAIGAAWLRALRRTDAKTVENLLPQLPQIRGDVSRLLALAWRLQQCRVELAGGGMSLAEASERLDELRRSSAKALEHSFRYKEFSHLERTYIEELSSPDADPAIAMLESVDHPQLLSGCRLLMAVCCYDAAPLFFKTLEKIAAAGTPVEICIHASGTEGFDRFGRPDPEFWRRRAVEFNPEKSFRRFSGVSAEAEAMAAMLGASYSPGAIGVLGEELRDALSDRAGNIRINAPERCFLKASAIGSFYSTLLDMDSSNPSFETVSALMRHSFILEYAVAQQIISEAGPVGVLIDEIQNETLCSDAAALRFALEQRSGNLKAAGVAALLKMLLDFASGMHASPKPLEYCYELFAAIGRACPEGLAASNHAAEHLELLGRLIVEASEAAPVDREIAKALWRRSFGEAFISVDNRDYGAVDAAGFLELEWRSDRHLVVGGMNAENFDYGSVSDSFLPESAQRMLGLPSENERYAADVCRFEAILKERRNGGSVIFSCSSGNSGGETLKPARLFFQCADSELPRRIEAIFGGELDVKKLQTLRGGDIGEAFFHIRSELPHPRMSITAFKSYLACPFRYYLDKVLGARELDDRAPEFDNMRFGTIAHSVLEECCRSAGATNAEAIEELALARLGALRRRLFGRGRAALSELQFELLEQNLRYFARRQDELYASGWRPVKLEHSSGINWSELYRRYFPSAPPEDWRSAITLAGKIDRIDRHEESGLLRVIDYKTNRNPIMPRDAHLELRRAAETGTFRTAPPDEKGRERVWSDLQLPLYCAILESGFVEGISGRAEGAYFNLPLAFSETGLALFSELSEHSYIESAVSCADAVLERIYRSSVFWPPRRTADPRHDVWSGIFGAPARENFILPHHWSVEE